MRDRRGVPSRLMLFPDENHWVLEPANRSGDVLCRWNKLTSGLSRSLKWHYEVFRWFDEWARVHH